MSLPGRKCFLVVVNQLQDSGLLTTSAVNLLGPLYKATGNFSNCLTTLGEIFSSLLYSSILDKGIE